MNDTDVETRFRSLFRGVPLQPLPVMEWHDFHDHAKNGRDLIAVAGIVTMSLNLSNTILGDMTMIKSGLGNDTTVM